MPRIINGYDTMIRKEHGLAVIELVDSQETLDFEDIIHPLSESITI